jgi:hypothetical protein
MEKSTSQVAADVEKGRGPGRPRHDLTGQPFGRLRVIGRAKNAPHGQATYACLCDPQSGGCGLIVTVRADSLLEGRTLSCGCLQREISRQVAQRTAQEAAEQLPVRFEARWLTYQLAHDPDFRREHETATRTWLRDPTGLRKQWNTFRDEAHLRAMTASRNGHFVQISSTDTSEWQLLCTFLAGKEALFVKLEELRAAEAAVT